MPAIYRHYEDEVQVFFHRIPQSDGGEPGYMATIGQWYMVLMWAAAFVASVLFPLFFWAPFLTGALFVASVVVLRRYYSRLVFRHSDQGIYRYGFLMGKYLGSFSDVRDFRLSEHPLLPDRVQFLIIWRDNLRSPEPLSPVVKNTTYLSRYYHDVVPLLRDFLSLPEENPEGEPADVVVESVAMRRNEAEALLGGRAVPAAVSSRELDDLLRREFHHFFYKEKTGLYYNKATRRQIVLAVLLILFLCVVLGVAIFGPSWLYRIAALAILMSLFLSTFPGSFAVRFDPATKEIHNLTRYGFKRTVYPLSHLVGIHLVNAPGLSAIVLKVRDPKAGCSVIEGTSADIRQAVGEVGVILGIDTEALMGKG